MARVVRCRLGTPEESLAFWQDQGPFRYAVQGCYDKSVYPNVLLYSDEWIFADELKALVRELLQWETRQLHAEWVFPTEEEYDDPVFGEFMVAAWEIIHLPETVGDFPWCILSDLPILKNPFLTPSQVEAAFLDWFAAHLGDLDEVLLFDFSKEGFEAYLLEDDSPESDDDPLSV